jgi:hypothetical protein
MWARERRRRMRLSALGVGMVSHRATTTTKIAYLEELDPDIYFMLFSDSLRDLGYVPNHLMTNRMWSSGCVRARMC